MGRTNPKTFVFVLMPFSKQFDDIYELGIKDACLKAGAYCERLDEQIYVENSLERIYNQISKADIIIAEMTGRNPNVFYEVGYAHALNKRVILLTQNAEDIPFDLKHYPHIVYEGKIKELQTQLEARVRWCIDNPQESIMNVDIDFELFVEGMELSDNPKIVAKKRLKHLPGGGYLSRDLSISLDIHNCSKKIANPKYFSVALLTQDSVEVYHEYEKLLSVAINLPNERLLYNLRMENEIFPDGWHTFLIPLIHYVMDTPLNFSVRLFTAFGALDYPFTLVIEE